MSKFEKYLEAAINEDVNSWVEKFFATPGNKSIKKIGEHTYQFPLVGEELEGAGDETIISAIAKERPYLTDINIINKNGKKFVVYKNKPRPDPNQPKSDKEPGLYPLGS